VSHLRIAVTGLKGSGKTVFLTSLLNNLLRGTAESFPAFRKRGVLFAAEPLPLAPTRRAFPYNAYLRAFRGDKPEWPAGTVDVSEFRLRLEMKKRRTRAVEIHLVDYPGERLLDLPLIGKSFEAWSDQVLDESADPCREPLARDWRAAVDAIPPGAAERHEAARRAAAAYKSYLLACREAGLQFLQPSAMLLPTEESAFLNLEFCPLPDRVRRSSPAVAAAFAARYHDYGRRYAAPFAAEAARCSRQIVLVDVLRVLRTGPICFRDTQRCIEEVLRAFTYGRHFPAYDPREWWRRMASALSLESQVERVAFVASKADLATRTNRDRLPRLLERLVRLAANRLRMRLDDGRILYRRCAAYRCTADAAKQVDGMPLAVLRGRRRMHGAEDKDGVWFPGEVPEDWPVEAYDPREEGLMFPEFLPAALPRERDDLPIPHLDLDEVFWSMVETSAR